MTTDDVKSALAPLDTELEADVEPDLERRRASIDALAAFMATVPSRPRVRRAPRLWLASAAAAAAAALALNRVPWPAMHTRPAPVAAGTLSGQGRALLAAGSGAPSAVLVSGRIPLAGELSVTDTGGVSVRTDAGLVVTLPAPSKVLLSELSRTSDARLTLLSGTAELQVPKRRQGDTFSVITPDARVVVHGTTFSVSVQGEGATARTCVHLIEGSVTVVRGSNQTLLAPGEQSGCDAPIPAVTPEPSAARVSTGNGRVAAEAPSPARATETPSTSLAQANHLLRTGLQLEQKGLYEQAQAEFARLLERYPSSPLAPEARASIERVERLRAQH